MKKLFLLCVAALTLINVHTNAEIRPIPDFDYVQSLFPGCTPEHCVIKKNNYGGFIMPFETAMKQMVERHTKLIIVDAICNSMCASIMDKIRDQGVRVCMTPRGEFGFHKRWMAKLDEHGDPIFDSDGKRIFDHWEEPDQSPKITQWIEGKGGAPISDAYNTNLHLSAEEAAREHLFEMCPTSTLTALKKK